MGIRTSSARLLCNLKKETDIDYSSVLMLGRQNLYMNKRQIQKMLKDYKDVLQNHDIQDRFCEKLFLSLGAKEINSLDASEFEGATIIHDMNQVVPVEWEESYTCIVDGGTTEHVYNFPQAMSNIMRMLKVGGYYIGLVPSNNFSGHGFYQFSPMLYLQLFCESNHFELKKLYMWRGGERHLLELVNLDSRKKRIEINGRRPSEVFVVARKTAPSPQNIALQQRDYIVRWEEEKNSRRKEILKKIVKQAPVEWYESAWFYFNLLREKKTLSKIKI